MGKTFIIVEHDSDKFTFEAILSYMQMQTAIDVRSAEVTDIEWLIRSAENNIDVPNGLKETFISLFGDIQNGNCERIGIIWDLDSLTNEQRISQMNNAITLAIEEYARKKAEITIALQTPITAINQFFDLIVDGIEVKIACYFVNYEGKGEIEDVLKAIKSQPSPLADCVDSKLPECLALNDEKELRNKDLVKLWINNYIRYDTLLKKDRKDAFTKWENVMLKRNSIFDFSKDEVIELKLLKDFLKMLNT